MILSNEQKAKLFDQIAEIYDASFQMIERAPRGVLRATFDEATVFVVMSGDGTVLAFALVTEKWGEPYIWAIATADGQRGHGFGTFLLTEIELYVRTKLRAAGIVLSTHVNNVGAQRLYLAKGYRVLKFLTNYYGSNEHGLMMRRPL